MESEKPREEECNVMVHADFSSPIVFVLLADTSPLPAHSVMSSSLLSDDEKTSSAAAFSTTSAPHPHLASVLESVSASASAPAVKQTRRDEQLAQGTTDRSLVSPMLRLSRLLGRDSGARLSLMRMLLLEDLCSLVQSGRLWSSWITDEPASVGRQQLTLQSSSTDSFGRCRWIRRSVQCVFFRGFHAASAQFAQFLRCMPSLFRLRSLVMWVGG